MAGDQQHMCLDLYSLPDNYFDKDEPISKVLAKARPGPFSPGSLATLAPIPLSLQLERTCGAAFYISLHFFPAALGLAACPFFLPSAITFYTNRILAGAATYMISLYAAWSAVSQQQGEYLSKCHSNLISARNNEKFFSIKAVWPVKNGPAVMRDRPAIYCMVPHGLLPLGTWSPFWAKACTAVEKGFRWTAAPALFNIPVISGILKKANVMPAKASHIRDAISKKGHSVGVVLDGVAGIFTGDASDQCERVHLGERKAIVAIALQAGVPIVPVYIYGHTSLYRVVVDPFGILKALSCKMNLALSPFLGRWGWPFGPPKRHPLLIAFGAPIEVPSNKAGEKPGAEVVDKYHTKLVDGFVSLFDTHKAAYGIPNARLIVE